MCSVVVPRDLPRDFEYGLGPILSWLRIIGVDLKEKQPDGCRNLFLFYRAACLLFSTSSHLMWFYYLLNYTGQGIAWIENERESQTISTIICLDHISDFIHPVGIHLSLLIQLRGGWNALRNSLDALCQLVTHDYYENLCKICTLSVVYILTMVSSNFKECYWVFINNFLFYFWKMTIILSAYFCSKTEMGEKDISIEFCLDAMTVLTLFYSLSATILFCILCRIASKNLNQIRQKTNELIVEKPVDAVNRIFELKEYYFRNAEFVHQINRYFGVILLLEISNGVFEILISTLFLFVGIINVQPWSFQCSVVCFISFYTINIIIIALISEKISQEV